MKDKREVQGINGHRIWRCWVRIPLGAQIFLLLSLFLNRSLDEGLHIEFWKKIGLAVLLGAKQA